MAAPSHILLVDTVPHGHHPLWLRELAAALATVAPVTLVTSPALSEASGTAGLPTVLVEGRLSAADLLARSQEAALEVGADHVVHAYGVKELVTAWTAAPPMAVPGSAIVFSPPPLHFPSRYASSLTLQERARAILKERMFRRWRRRPDLRAVWTLDPVVAERWNGGPGARTWTMKEPAVDVGALERFARQSPIVPDHDVVVYGAIGPRKGLALLADALAEPGRPLDVLVAGRILDRDRAVVEQQIAAIRSTGSSVTVEDAWIEDADILTLLARARCALLAYVRHTGDSRVLLESASAGVPVVAHSWGLLGDTVRRAGLGEAVDCTSAPALRRALDQVLSMPPGSWAAAQERFAAEHDGPSFVGSVVAPFVD